MLKVTQFVTSDGKEFGSIEEAKGHECDLKAGVMLTHLLSSSLSTGRHQAVISHILTEGDSIMDILRSYKKSLPKAKKLS